MSDIVRFVNKSKKYNNSVKIYRSLETNILRDSEKIGKILYNQNENYKAIANLMEHPEFRQFYNKYLSDSHNIKTIIMFLKLYEEIEKYSLTPLTGYQKIYILDKIMKNSELRRKIYQEKLDSN